MASLKWKLTSRTVDEKCKTQGDLDKIFCKYGLEIR